MRVVALVRSGPAYIDQITRLLPWSIAEIADRGFEAGSVAMHQRLLDGHGKPLNGRVEEYRSRRVPQNGVTLPQASAAVALDAAPRWTWHMRSAPVSGPCPDGAGGKGFPHHNDSWRGCALVAIAILEEQRLSVLHPAHCVGYASDHPLRHIIRELPRGSER